MIYDVIFRNAKILDGARSPWFRGSVAIRAGRIERVGNIPAGSAAREEIDVQDNFLCPGFIDAHTHSDFVLLRDPAALPKLKQGVTTQVIGQCGFSPAPVEAENIPLLDSYMGFIKAGVKPVWNWRSFGEWLEVLEQLDLGTNIAGMFGHGTVKIDVMGFDDRLPERSEMEQMKTLVRDSMREGAFGMTSGLAYPPGLYSSREELLELTAVLAEFDGLYATHMMNESNDIVRCIQDTIEILERNRIRGQISHHKVTGEKNRGMIQKTLALIEAARKRGIDIAADQYPYTATSTTLRSILPPWVSEGGLIKMIERLENEELRTRIKNEIHSSPDPRWENQLENCGGPENAVILYTPETLEFQGKNLLEISRITGQDYLDAAFDIIIRNRGCDTAYYFEIAEEDVHYAMRHPLVMIASDSIPPAPGSRCHPRANGTFPRVIGRYVRDGEVLSLEEAVWKMSGFPASRIGLRGKGQVSPGMDADLVVFDLDKIAEGADYRNPDNEPEGILYVFVNGEKVLDHGSYTRRTPGKVIRRS